MMKNILILVMIVSPLIFCGQNFKNRNIVGEEYAKQAIKKALSDSSGQSISDTLIKNKEMAIAIAEPILMNLYGKAVIAAEKPYECYLIDGYWFIGGTLPKNNTGSIF